MNKDLKGIPSIDKPWLKWYTKIELNTGIPYMSVYNFLRLSITNQSNIAINYLGQKITYQKLLKNIDEVALSFKNLKVKDGDIVTICAPTSPETIYCIYALNKIGAVAALIDPNINEKEIKDFINLFESKCLVTINSKYPKIKNILGQTDVVDLICISPTDSIPKGTKLCYNLGEIASNISLATSKLSSVTNQDFKKINCMNWSKFNKLAKDEFVKSVDYKKNKPAAIVLTRNNGKLESTVLSNENLNYLAVANSCSTNMKEKDTFLNIMSPFTIDGLVCGINNVLCNGLEMIIVPKFEKNMFDSILIKHSPNHVLGDFDYFYELISSDRIKDKSLNFIKSANISGYIGLLSEKMINYFLAMHDCEIKINKSYMRTELSSMATYTKCNFVNKKGSVGIPIVYNNIKILNPITKEELGYNEIGELYVTGPGVALGYFKSKEENKKSFIEDANGIRWFKTNNLFSMDKDGVLFYHGRIDNLSKENSGKTLIKKH